MRRLLAIALSLVVAAPTAGCGSEDEPPPPSGNETLVTYTRSGGFAPVLEKLTIEADGDGVASTGFGAVDRRVRSFRLDPDQLAQLKAAIDAVPFDEIDTGQYTCADCYAYSVKIAGADVTLSDTDFMTGSGADVPPELDDLFGLLGELSRRYVPAHPTPGGA